MDVVRNFKFGLYVNGSKCRNPGVQFHLSPKFAYKKLVWVAFAEVRLSVCVRVFDRRNRIIHYNSHLA